MSYNVRASTRPTYNPKTKKTKNERRKRESGNEPPMAAKRF
jgi:hypothetical protein